MIISNRGLFRKLFSFYTLIISYIPKRGHHNVVISTKSLFRIISTLILYKISVKTSVKYRFCDTCVSGFLEKKNLESGVLSALTKYLSYS